MFTNPNTRCVRKMQGDAPLIIAIIFILLTPAAFYGGAWYFGKVWNLKLRKEERNWKLWKTSWKGCGGANSDNFSHHRSAGRHQRGRTCHQTMGVRGFFWGRIINFWGWIIIIIWGKDNCFKLTSGRTGTAQGLAMTRWTDGTVMSMAGKDNWPNYNHNKEPEKKSRIKPFC